MVMKYTLTLFFVTGFACCYSQNLVKTINISPGEGSVTTSLPFDRPIILKWTSKDPIIVDYVGLVEIIKGNVSDYYMNWAQDNSFMMFNKNEDFGNNTSKVRIKEVKTTMNLNADGKYDLNIIIPPLAPNKFYDIKILRKPLDQEASLYVDLFSDVTNLSVFEKKLRYINQIKMPFMHIYFEGPQKGKLTTDQLLEFYEVYLKQFYLDIAAAAGDKDKIATATAKIKAAIVNDQPADGVTQSRAYAEVFEAIHNGNDVLLNTKIIELGKLLAGHIPTKRPGTYAGQLGASDFKHFYANYPRIKVLLDSAAQFPAQKDEMKKRLANAIFFEYDDLPKADEFFKFGQTLSSTTASLDFDTRTGYTITPDFGYVYYGFQKDFNAMTPYVGFQLEFRYFDKNIPFNLIHPKSPWHYLSFTTGLTLTSLKKEGKRDDFFASKSLLVGLGWRLSSATRVTFGGILFNKEDVNPLIDNKRLTITPFVGLSIDLRIKSIINDFYGLAPTKKP
jgi:hypothetical protein